MNRKYALQRALAPNVFEAFRQLVYLGDVEKLATFMGLKVGTLYNKADSGDDTHNQPTLRDVIQATHFRGDMRVVDAINGMFGRASYDCAQHQGTTDEALLELLTALGAETGEFHTALAAGLKQKRFTLGTLKLIRAEAFDIVSALMTLVARLEDYVDEDEINHAA
jgi:hypothetical protein